MLGISAGSSLQVAQPRPEPPRVPEAPPSTAELSMVLKTLQSLVPAEFPKLEPGDPHTRARRLQQWLLQVELSLEPAGPFATSWWTWVKTSAEETHNIFLQQPLDQREHVLPRDTVPPQFAPIEAGMRSRILPCLPKSQREWIELRTQAGRRDQTNTLVYFLYKVFAPGSPAEKDSLVKEVLNPNVCTNPSAAQIELLRWRTSSG